MGCLNSMFNTWINVLYMRRKVLGVRPAKDCFRKNSTLRAALSLVFKTIPRSLVVVTGWYGLGVGWVMGREGVSDEMGELPSGRCSLLLGLRSSSHTLDKLALMFREFWRI